MADVDRVRTVKRAAAARLHAIPGVHATGVGFKVTGGKKTDELAIAVFVDKKKKPEELPEREIIPAEIEGVRTDVAQLPRVELLNAAPSSVTATVAPLPKGAATEQSITLTGKNVPEKGLVVAVDLTVQPDVGDSSKDFAFVETDGRKSLDDLADELEDRLKEVTGIVADTTDVSGQVQVSAKSGFSVQVTRACVLAIDQHKYFKDYVRGGIQIQRGANSGYGTLGCLATTAPTPEDPQGKVVGLTNVHVVCPPVAGETNLRRKVVELTSVVFSIHDDDDPNATTVTPGTLVLLEIHDVPKPFDLLYSAFYTAGASDTPEDIAQGLVDAVSDAPKGVTVSLRPDDASTIVLQGPATLDCDVIGPTPEPDSTIRLTATVTHADATTNAIEFQGEVSTENYGIFLNITPGGTGYTFGSFTNPKKGATLEQVAQCVLTSIQGDPANPNPLLGNVGVTLSGATITVTNAQTVACTVVKDIRVGQPNHDFGSTCSFCCSHRIGRILDAQIHSDVALIQLDPGLNYKLEIEGIPGAITASTSLLLPMLAVEKRGRTSGLTKGTVSYVEVTIERLGHGGGFYRLAEHAFMIDSASDDPFSIPGDSGSAVISSVDNSLVGLLFGHVGTTTTGIASEIGPLVAAFPDYKLAFSPASGVNVDTVQVVPKPAAAFQALDDAAQAVTIPTAAPFGFAATRFAKRLDEAENEILATPLGRQYVDVVRRHLQEALTLVNKNRRVATVWRRSGGPEILDGLARMIQFRNERLPAEINGRPLADCLSRIQRIVMRYASPAFTDDLIQYAPGLAGFARMTYSEVLAHLQFADSE
jgi:hypothetical protein